MTKKPPEGRGDTGGGPPIQGGSRGYGDPYCGGGVTDNYNPLPLMSDLNYSAKIVNISTVPNGGMIIFFFKKSISTNIR